MKNFLFLMSLILVLAGCRSGQLPTNSENADLLYEKRHYAEAANMYNKLIKKEKDEKTKKQQTLKLANCYRQMNDYSNAVLWYKKVVDENVDQPEYRYLYADLLMSNNDYRGAIEQLNLYGKEVPSDKRVAEKINTCNQALELSEKGSRFVIKPLEELNSSFNDYAPIFSNGSLYFTSDRAESTGSEKYPWLGTYYSDIFVSEFKNNTFDNAKPLGNNINTELNEGAATFNGIGDVIIFTQCSGAGFDSSCALLIATKERGNWNKAEPINFGLDAKYMYGQASLSADGKTLVFVSNMPGGYGGHDLYMSVKQGNNWSKPTNLGAKINTAKDEMFPYLKDENTLYFSSNGHVGFGALDIFVSEKRKDAWKTPSNLLPPINSGGDDFSFSYNNENAAQTSGFFCSNRKGSAGDDIYSFEIVSPPLSTLCGTVYDNKTKKPLANSIVFLTDIDNNKSLYFETNEKGEYCMKLYYEKEYKLDAYKKYYSNNQEIKRISTKGLNFQKSFKQDFYLDKWTVEEIEIEGILYDLDRADLRPESKVILDSLAAILNIHFYLVVELSSHTDCRGSEIYNQDLSQRRAESCVNYLISKGISRERLQAKGYGETKLINDCACEGQEGKGINCTEAQHQENRRTSFQIIRTDFEPISEPDFGEKYVDPEE